MIVVEVQTQVRVASGVKAIVVQAADRVEPLDSECTTYFLSSQKKLIDEEVTKALRTGRIQMLGLRCLLPFVCKFCDRVLLLDALSCCL